MTPYYRDEFVTIYCADAYGMLGISRDCDHVMTDPPYDETTHEGAQSDWRPGYGVGFAPLADVGVLVEDLAPRRWALAFCALEMLGDYKRAAAGRWVRAGIWDRLDGAPQFSGDRPAQSAEGIAIWHAAAAKRWNGRGKRAVWRAGIVRGDERVHETQKPLALMRALVLDFTDAGETIFDPFAGSGTTGVAAKVCGRHAVLVENDEARCALAAERLRATDPDARLSAVGAARAKQAAFDWRAVC